jgi:hypothetical protein
MKLNFLCIFERFFNKYWKKDRRGKMQDKGLFVNEKAARQLHLIS